jgi:signal peptidase I
VTTPAGAGLPRVADAQLSRDRVGGSITIIIAIAIAGLLTGAVLLYGGFLLIDTADGFYSKNVSSSMAPAILSGDYITSRALRRAIRVLDLRRGDLIVFAFPPDPSKQFIKRVVGLPGDTLTMTDGKLLVNGGTLREPYAHRDEPTVDPVVDDFDWQRRYLAGKAATDTSKYLASRNNWGPLEVPRGAYFVLGDNRDNSLDSRYFGFVPAAEVQARVRRIYFSRDSTGRIRWSRIGKRVE